MPDTFSPPGLTGRTVFSSARLTTSMLDLQPFLSLLVRGLDRFEERLKAKDAEIPIVKYLPDGGRVIGRDEIAIGTGKFEFSNFETRRSIGLCLNDKQAGPVLKTAGVQFPEAQVAGIQTRDCFTSVTDLALNAPLELFNQWRTIVGEHGSPYEFFDRFSLVVEDVSPDSCFGLLCILMRFADIPKEMIPDEWARYIEGWERGDIVLGENVYCTYGCLHNALVHAKLSSTDGTISDRDIGEAWIQGLRLMTHALASKQSPLNLSISSPIFLRAQTLLRFEEQKYEESLDHAICLQLALPIAGTKNRYRLVDAYFAEQTLPLGSLKVFARTDKNRPFLKNGYSLLAVYRSTPVGDGDDLTISVDPRVGIELKDLWLKLEQAEDQAWGPNRPHDNPRAGIIGYPDRKRADGSNAPNEPWYDGRDYSLLAAPRKLGADGAGQVQLGSKLKWNVVLEFVWQTYQPLKHIKLRPGTTPSDNVALTPLEECPRENLANDPDEMRNVPRLFVAGWCRPNDSAPAFHITPTLCKCLAACIKRWQRGALPGPIELSELPDDSTYDVLKLPGIIAIVSEFGAFILYDAQRLTPPLVPMKTEFERAVKLRQRIEAGGSHLAIFLDDIKAYYGGRRRDLIEDDLLERLTSEQIDIALELHQAHADVIPYEARRFREVVLNHWGIEGWLDTLARDIAQIKNVLYGRADLDRARHIAFLRRYGSPIALAAVIYAIGSASEKLWVRSQSRLSWVELLADLNWFGLMAGLLVMALLSATVFGLLEFSSWRRRRKLLRMLSVVTADKPRFVDRTSPPP